MNSEKMAEKLNHLKAAIKTATNKGGVRMAVEMADINQALSEFLEALNEDDQKQAEEEREAEDEEEARRATYDLHHRRLIGLAEEIRPLARKRPDSPCNAYKLQQVNEVLSLLKEELDVCFNADLALADEDAALSYSDVSLMLRIYQDVSAAYVRRHYNGNPPKMSEVPENWAMTLVQDQILTYCMDQPRSIREIGTLLGYTDKKTTRKYLNPLLRDGLLARTVPDKPNSRNQKYLTARNL